MGNPAEKRSVTRTALTMHPIARQVKRLVRLFLQKVAIKLSTTGTNCTATTGVPPAWNSADGWIDAPHGANGTNAAPLARAPARQTSATTAPSNSTRPGWIGICDFRSGLMTQNIFKLTRSNPARSTPVQQINQQNGRSGLRKRRVR